MKPKPFSALKFYSVVRGSYFGFCKGNADLDGPEVAAFV